MMPLRTARISRKLSQKKLGKALKIQQAVISRAEKDFKPVTPENAEKLAHFFGFPWTEMHFLYPERYRDIDDVDSEAA